MKLLITITLSFLTGLAFSQNTFFQLPETPTAPSAGSTSPISSEIMTSEDGKIYVAYIYNNGTNDQLYVDEYTGGTWTTIYQDFVYDSFEAIHSYKQGSDNYFILKMDNAVSQEMFRVFKINTSGVSIVTSAYYSDILDQANFDFSVSTSGQFGYLLHKDISNINLILSQIDLTSGIVQNITVPITGNTFNHYEMLERYDTVYVAYNGYLTANNIYFYKIPSNLSGTYVFDGSASAILPGSLTTAPQELMMGFDNVANTINITSKTNVGNLRYTYDPFTASLVTNSSTFVSDAASPGISRSEFDGIYHFNNFTDGLSGLPTTMVIKENLPGFDIDTVANFTFNGIGAQATNHRMNYSYANNRVVASYYDVMASSRKFYATNEAPVVIPGATVLGSACSNQYTVLVENISINEANNDYLNIISITSSNTTACDGANLSWSLLPQTGTTQHFQIYGQVGVSGSFDLTIEVTDGFDTITYTLPTLTINTPPVPSFNSSLLHLCTGNGEVNLNDYIDIPGGTFYINLLEVNFIDGLFDTDNNPLTQEQVYELSYETQISGCFVSTTVDIVTHDGPVITIAATPSTCGGNTGGATATIAGGTIPFTLQLWSTGELGTSVANNLAPGQYTYTVQDANTCLQTSIFDIPAAGVDAIGTIQNVQCDGQHNGSISLSTVGLTAPISYLWSSGHSVASIDELYAGSYTVQITDADNCVFTKTFIVTEPEELVGTYNSVWPSCGLADGLMEIIDVTGGTAPYTYQWSTGDTGPSVSSVPFGLYSATITDNNGCQIIKPFYMSEVGSAELYGSITPASCGGSDGAINVDPYLLSADPIQSISWSNGASTEDISDLVADNYVCTLTTTANCKAIKGWDIPIVNPELQPICIVTVDSATTTNLVVWEPVQFVGIAYYKIYRETSNFGDYVLIDTVQATNLSVFNDVVASPVVRSWSYKISAVNGCEVEGPISAHHRTIHLNVTDAGASTQITWNGYEGTTDYNDQTLWRYTIANDWEIVATLPVGDFVYVDPIAFTTPGLDYMIELNLNTTCTAEKAQDFNTTRSNKDKGQFVAGDGTGNSNNSIDEAYMSAILVHPNPANEQLFITQLLPAEMTIHITDINGKLLINETMNGLQNTLAIDNLAEGIYIIELLIDNRKETRRFIKQ